MTSYPNPRPFDDSATDSLSREQAWARHRAALMLAEMSKAVAAGEVHSFRVSWEGFTTAILFEMCPVRVVAFEFKDDIVKLEDESGSEG